MTPLILPCPFCGSNRVIKGERYFAMCVDCGATGPERVRQSTSAAVFNGDWNTRINSHPELMKALELAEDAVKSLLYRVASGAAPTVEIYKKTADALIAIARAKSV